MPASHRLRFHPEELRHVAELLVAGGEQIGDGDLLEFGEVLLQGSVE